MAKTTKKTPAKKAPTNSNLNIPLLASICERPGAPGFEQPIRELILKSIQCLADEITVDPLGNILPETEPGHSPGKRVLGSRFRQG